MCINIKNNVTWSFILATLMIMTACSGRNTKEISTSEIVTDTDESVLDSMAEMPDEPEKPELEFYTRNEVTDYIDSLPDAANYRGGILYTVAEHVPKYAGKLLASEYSRFLVVDKASMRVLLYDRYGQEVKAYDMACAKNYGTKHKKADSRTPEGFFSVEGIYNSTDWLFTDDDGRTSKKKGQFGPRFIRLRIPGTSQIGIHGTCSPWSIGHRASHGCIRLTNENILELVELVEPGMPAIVLPGKRDRAVNREEGYDIPYFPTAAKYAMSDYEKTLKPRDQEEILREKELQREKEIRDSLAAAEKWRQELREREDSISASPVHETTGSESSQDSTSMYF